MIRVGYTVVLRGRAATHEDENGNFYMDINGKGLRINAKDVIQIDPVPIQSGDLCDVENDAEAKTAIVICVDGEVAWVRMDSGVRKTIPVTQLKLKSMAEANKRRGEY